MSENKMQWISVHDRLPNPKKDGLYLCWIDNGMREPYADVRMWFVYRSDFAGAGVTHWMEMPEAPEVEQ